ncbi:MAG: sugar phosphate isomerase/epimerase family protein [Limisphaerales bacterium]
MHPAPLSRRRFAHVTATAALAALAPSLPAAAPAPRWPIIGFSKPFQTLGPEQTADTVAEIGWDGIECPVRAKGQVLPERVEEDLPKLVAALRQRGKAVHLITTDVKNVAQPFTEKVLRTAAKLGIKRYRLSFWKYAKDKPIPAQLDEIRAELRDLVALNKELGLQAGFQNHSGADYVGAPVWDIWQLVRELDPKLVGACFDIGHATIEGGYSWPSTARLMEPHFTAVFVKDFAWKKGDKGWKAEWCPLGEGMVNKSFFAWLKKSSFNGPISQHHEYDYGEGKPMIAKMQQDLRVLREWLA